MSVPWPETEPSPLALEGGFFSLKKKRKSCSFVFVFFYVYLLIYYFFFFCAGLSPNCSDLGLPSNLRASHCCDFSCCGA